MKIRHPFRVAAVDPRFTGPAGRRVIDQDSKRVRLVAANGKSVGNAELVVCTEFANDLPVGAIVTLEIRLPAKPPYDSERGEAS